jgi:tRNA threonylcarbamoyl adenosine modification protein YeaZ
MLVLAFDTSTFHLSAGWILVSGEAPDRRVEDFAQLSVPARPGHAETLLGRLEQLLETGGHHQRDVGLVVYGRGPGTFTGLRIGLATAKGMAISHGAPIVGVSTLAALAASAGVDGLVVPLIDARRLELYAAVYRVGRGEGGPSPALLARERVITAAAIPDLLAEAGAGGDALFCGSGAVRYAPELAGLGTSLPPERAAPSAVMIARMGLGIHDARGGDDLSTVEPIYLREPDARLPDKPLA